MESNNLNLQLLLRQNVSLQESNVKLENELLAAKDRETALECEVSELRRTVSKMLAVWIPDHHTNFSYHEDDLEERLLEAKTSQLKKVLAIINQHEALEATLEAQVSHLRSQLDNYSKNVTTVSVGVQTDVESSVLPELKAEFFQHFDSTYLKTIVKTDSSENRQKENEIPLHKNDSKNNDKQKPKALKPSNKNRLLDKLLALQNTNTIIS